MSRGIGPDASQAWDTLGGDREVGAGADQDFFQAADEFDRRLEFCVCRLGSLTKSAQVKDGIADDLSGTVKSDVAAAVAFEEFDATLAENFGRCDNVSCFRVAAQGDDWRMLEEQEDVADLFFFAQGD